TRNDRAVANFDMPAQHGIVSHGDIVANVAVMRDMGLHHEQAIVADGGLAAARVRAAMHRHAFADDVAAADLQRRASALVLEVLRRAAKHGIRVDLGSGAETRAVKNRHMADELAIIPQNHIRRYVAERSDTHTAAKLRALVYNCTGMNKGHAAAVSGSSFGVISAEIT